MPASRRLYETVAKTVAYHRDHVYDNVELGHLQSLVLELCMDFKVDNPSFNKDKFLRACGMGHLADN